MKRVAENIIMSHAIRASLAWTLVAGCLAAIVLYAFLVNKAIFQAVEAKQLSSSIGEISARLNVLQSKYISVQSGATIAKARELGFSEITNQRFISRKSLSSILSLRDEI